MAWEKRQGKLYYYRKRRIDGHVVSEYLGRARDAALASQAAAEKAERRTQDQIELDQLDELTRLCDEFAERVDVLVRAHLLINGYHYHRGEWRKRRNLRRNRPNPADAPSSPDTPTT